MGSTVHITQIKGLSLVGVLLDHSTPGPHHPLHHWPPTPLGSRPVHHTHTCTVQSYKTISASPAKAAETTKNQKLPGKQDGESSPVFFGLPKRAVLFGDCR